MGCRRVITNLWKSRPVYACVTAADPEKPQGFRLFLYTVKPEGITVQPEKQTDEKIRMNMIIHSLGQTIETIKKTYRKAAPPFDIRNKILLALQELPEMTGVCLEDVSEVDETFVLDCYKSRPMDAAAGRSPRRHGAKTKKRGISSKYLCICTGIRRKGETLAAAVNRAKPSAKELLDVFECRIADGTLVLCDGRRSYHAIPGIADYIVKDCNDRELLLSFEHGKWIPQLYQKSVRFLPWGCQQIYQQI